MSFSIKRLRTPLMTPNQAAVGGFVLAGFFICWFVYAYLWDDILCAIGGKNNLSGWAQAIGVFLAIIISGNHIAKQIRHSEAQQFRIQQREDKSSVWSCLYACRDAHQALRELSNMLIGKDERSPRNYIERIEGLEETIRVLLASKPHAAAVSPLLTVLAQLAYARVAIRESKGGAYKMKEGVQALRFVIEANDAVDMLAKLYKCIDEDDKKLISFYQ